MRSAIIATLLCVGAIAAAGCGTETDAGGGARASSRDGGPPPPAPVLVEVPDVIGQTAEEGGSALEAEGLLPAFDPVPEDPSLCTVSDQDETGQIEEGSEVVLTLECKVDVPDVSDEPSDDAVSRLEDLRLATSYEEQPRDSSVCTVDGQDVVGEADPESEVVLSLVCKVPNVTGKDLETAVSGLELAGYAADHRIVDDPRLCTVTSHASKAEPRAAIALQVHCQPSPASATNPRPRAPASPSP